MRHCTTDRGTRSMVLVAAAWHLQLDACSVGRNGHGRNDRSRAMNTLMSYILYKTGFRFSKDYRYGITIYHRIVYRLINTVRVNQLADRLEDHYRIYKSE